MRSDIVNKLIWKLAELDHEQWTDVTVYHPTPKFLYTLNVMEDRKDYLRCKIYKVSKDQKTEDTEIIKIGKKLIEERRNR